MPWDAIKYVGLGLTLAAFVVAAIAWLLKSKSEEKERLIDLAKDEERAGLVRDALEFFSVDTAGLTKAQEYQLALEQIRARATVQNHRDRGLHHRRLGRGHCGLCHRAFDSLHERRGSHGNTSA